MKRIPTTLVTASTDMDYARLLQRLLSTSDLRVYANSDIVGVELGGSVKNVIAIAAAYGYLAPDSKIEQWMADFILHSADQTEALLNSLKFA
ncbi:MAG: hypothetical protein IIC10_03870 [Proteobacteria bacterium]|nr:hypothetical protein [Pseudomonadota bacterium]